MIYLNNSTKIEVPEELDKVLRAFLPIFQTVIEDDTSPLEELALVALRRGLDEMLEDLLGDNPAVLSDSFKAILHDNPEYLGRFIFKALKKGEEIIDQQIDNEIIAEKWKKRPYYI